MKSFSRICESIQADRFVDYFGHVERVRSDSIHSRIPGVKVGTICAAQTVRGDVPLEIVSLDPAGHVAMPLDDLHAVQLGDRVRVAERAADVPVGDRLLGKIVDSLCKPYTGEELSLRKTVPLYGIATNPMLRVPIREPLDLGVRSINACITCGRGQRTGIFAGSGVGKSVLLGMMARYTSADVVVIGLIGERGREVREFIERDLGEGLKKSVVVVETAERSAVRRARGAFAAASIADYFRQQGAQVLLLMDSLTRYAMAQREIGIAAGEPPTTKGYTPSVFSGLSRLVERAGNWGERGAITGLYTVLVEGDDLEDPVADSARAILDGHIVLSRRLADRGHFPAIDVLSSVSRVMDAVVSPDHLRAARKVREWMARFAQHEDAIQYGMYARGTDSLIDQCIEKEPLIMDFLKQDRLESCGFEASKDWMEALLT